MALYQKEEFELNSETSPTPGGNGQSASAPKRKRRFTLPKIIVPPLVYWAIAFVVGLLFGWLVIGWWLWPVDWTNSAPWQLAPTYQRTFISMVAERFWQSSDVAQAQKDVAGWKRDDLDRLLNQMQRETTDPEKRKQLALLGDALRMPIAETSLTAALFSQQTIVLGMVLALVPLLAAVALVTLPLINRQARPQAADATTEEAIAESNLEELLVDIQLGTEAGTQEQVKEGEKKEEEKKEEKPPEDEQSEESGSGLSDLANLFEEEDTSITALEQFCKGMPDITADQLFANAMEIRHKLREAIAARPIKK